MLKSNDEAMNSQRMVTRWMRLCGTSDAASYEGEVSKKNGCRSQSRTRLRFFFVVLAKQEWAE
jgi:hypothetical protein